MSEQATFDSTCAYCIGLLEPDGEWCHLGCAEEEPWPYDWPTDPANEAA